MNKEETIGWIGFCSLQICTIPAIIKVKETGVGMPILSILLIILGLSCYLYRAWVIKDILHIVGNIVGIVTNIILLYFSQHLV